MQFIAIVDYQCACVAHFPDDNKALLLLSHQPGLSTTMQILSIAAKSTFKSEQKCLTSGAPLKKPLGELSAPQS